MAIISTVEARGEFTKRLVSVYNERTAPSAFLRSFFPSKESMTLEVSIEVRRGTEKIAVDVARGTRGNSNKFTKSTEKIFVPPYYREYFSATDLDFYDRLFSRSETVDLDPATFAEWLDTVMEKIEALRDKIDRAYELQCAEVLDTGIVSLKSGDNIDFKRKVASMVTLTGAFWDNAATDPTTSLITGLQFLRTEGKWNGATVNAIMGQDAFQALVNNEKFQKKSDIKDFDLNLIREPQRNAEGAALQGSLSAGSWKVIIWTYPQYYTNTAGAETPYIGSKKVILLPDAPKFVFAFGGIPTLRLTGNNNIPQTIAPVRGSYVVGEYLDPRKATHEFDIQSAGIAVPVAVDQLYTLQVLA